MQRATELHSVTQTLAAGRFTGLRLQSRPQTRGLAGELQAIMAALVAAHQRYLAARDEVLVATAEVEYLDGEVDIDVVQLGREARPLVKGDTSHPDWMLAFPISPSAGTAQVGGNAQARYVNNLVDRINTLDTFAPLRDRAAEVKVKLDTLTAAEAEREVKRQALGQARQERRVAQLQVHKVYNLLYPRAQLVFPEQLRLVESFFYTFVEAGQPKPVVEDGETEDAEG